MERALGMHQFLAKKFPVLEFDGIWKEVFGSPSANGSWIIWGQSGSGKTRFALQLCKYLTRFGKVAYNSLEEGYCYSLQRAFRESGLAEVGNRVIPWDKVSVADMRDLLRKPKSPDIIFVDSFQYTRMSYEDYQDLKNEFRNKLFVFISHADGKEPRGGAAQAVRYDCEIKIRVEGFRAIAASRSGGGIDYYTIWNEGSALYWDEKNEKEI